MPQERDARGRYLPGPIPDDVRKKISESQIARHERARQAAVDKPRLKQCSSADCDRVGQWLRVPEDFYVKRKRLKSGEIVNHPSGQCRHCEAKRRHKWRQEFIAEHGEEEWKKVNKRWNANRDPERTRKIRRESRRINDALIGRYKSPRGPLKKYLHELTEPLPLVPAKPFVDWFLSLNGARPTEDQMGESLARNVRRAVHGGHDSVSDVERRRVHMETVDAVGILAGVPHLISALYPNV